MKAEVDHLIEAIDALAGLDLSQIDANELDRAVAGLVRQRHRLDATIARAVHRWDRSGRWALDGSRSPAARLARDAGISVATAQRCVRQGRSLIDLPASETAWSNGDISGDHVDLLAGARKGRESAFERDESTLVEQCTTLRFAEAKKIVDYWRHRADADAGRDGPAPIDTECRISHTGDTVYGTFTLDAVGGATVDEALRRISNELRLADRRNGIERSARQRRAAALVEMAIRSTTNPAGGRRPEPLVMVLAGEQSFAHLCELAAGHVIHPGSIIPHLDHAMIQTIVFDGADRPITASPSRTFRGTLRRAIQARDRHCQHPSGCDEPITHCDIDHIIPHHRGGRTDVDNGRLECAPHNRRSDLHDRSPDHRQRSAEHAERHRLDQLRGHYPRPPAA